MQFDIKEVEEATRILSIPFIKFHINHLYLIGAN